MTERIGKYTYLASPYSSPSKRVQHERYLAVTDCLVYLLRERTWAYSPIVHCHELARLHELPTDMDFWLDYNRAMIDRAADVLVLATDGWKESRGVKWEIEYARGIGIGVAAIWPEADGYRKQQMHPPSGRTAECVSTT